MNYVVIFTEYLSSKCQHTQRALINNHILLDIISNMTIFKMLFIRLFIPFNSPISWLRMAKMFSKAMLPLFENWFFSECLRDYHVHIMNQCALYFINVGCSYPINFCLTKYNISQMTLFIEIFTLDAHFILYV